MFSPLIEVAQLKMQTQTFPQGEVRSTYKIVSTMWVAQFGASARSAKFPNTMAPDAYFKGVFPQEMPYFSTFVTTNAALGPLLTVEALVYLAPSRYPALQLHTESSLHFANKHLKKTKFQVS